MYTLLSILTVLTVPTVRSDEFNWHKVIAAGKTIEIVGVNGSIDAAGTSGREVEVFAVKTGRKSDPAEVEISVVDHPEGVTICAVYPSRHRDDENECRPGGKSHMNSDNNDVQVAWTIKVPAGVRFTGRTVNGHVTARGLGAEAEARTVNGSIDLSTTSWARASTVNGSITAELGKADWPDENRFSTVNGGITVALPSAASLEVSASTVNGSMSTEFPLTVTGRWGPHRMSGSIGQREGGGGGGRSLTLHTVNGSVQLRQTVSGER